MKVQNASLPLNNFTVRSQKTGEQILNNQKFTDSTSTTLSNVPCNYFASISFRGTNEDYADYITVSLDRPDEVANIRKVEAGQKFKLPFTISREEIKTFAEISGDRNPIHVSPEYIKRRCEENPKFLFKDNISHGLLAAGKFSAFYGILIPGEDTLYRNINIDFKAPIFPGKQYFATFEVLEIKPGRQAVFRNKIIDAEDGHVCIDGTSSVSHPAKIEKIVPPAV